MASLPTDSVIHSGTDIPNWLKNTKTNSNTTIENPLKRTASSIDLTNEDSDGDSSSEDYSPFYVSENCDQVRRKINKFIDNGGMKVGEFIKAIGVSSVSYYRFMKQSGKDKGATSDTYMAAYRFFVKRIAQGLPMPKKRKIVASKPTAASKSATDNETASTSNNAPTLAALMSTIELPGELNDSVRIYDSCDEIRRKINAHLRKSNVTQAAFLRDLEAQFHGPRKPVKLQSGQLSKFRGMKGPLSGNTSGIYYAAYVFFEKERLAQKCPKSKHRQEMEYAWSSEGGVDTKSILSNQSYIVSVGSRIVQDSCGRVRSVPKY